MGNYYDINSIQQYLAGNLSKKEMHQIELDALKDPMLQDAIDGFESSKTINIHELSILQQRLQKRITQQHEERNHFYFGRQRLAIASIAGLLFIVAGILFWMINFPIKKSNQEPVLKEVSVHLQPEVETAVLSGNLEPTIGWKDYQHYLQINNQEHLAGEQVELAFDIINNRATSIKVISSSSEKATIETIRLIKDGPQWNGTSGVLIVKF
jgi:hypothetical protein